MGVYVGVLKPEFFNTISPHVRAPGKMLLMVMIMMMKMMMVMKKLISNSYYGPAYYASIIYQYCKTGDMDKSHAPKKLFYI